MHFEGSQLWTDGDELCHTCKNVRICPMVEALVEGITLMATDGFLRLTCGLYSPETKPKLKAL